MNLRIKYLTNKGLTFLGNTLIFSLLLWLKIPSTAEFYRIVGSFTLFVRNLSPLFIIGVLILFGNRLINRLIFISLITIFLLGEGLTRMGVIYNLSARSWDYSNFYRYPKPFVEFSGKPNSSALFLAYEQMGGTKQDATITLNDLGFRGELPLPDKSEEFRIIMLGGSTVFNGVPLSKSIPGELEQLFHNNGFSKVKVYNWGVVSFNSGQELSLLVHSVADFNPDLVITYDGANDIHHSYVFEPRPGYPYNWQTYETGLNMIRNGPRLNQVVNLLLIKSSLIASVFGESLKTRIVESQGKLTLPSQAPDDLSYKTTQTYINNLNKMCNFSKGNSFKLAVILQPIILFKSPLVGNEKNLLGTEAIQSYVKQSYQIIEKDFKSLSENPMYNNQCFFYDSSKIFSDYNQETYWDFVHTDNDGNKYIATQIYNSIKNQFNTLSLKLK